MFNLLRDQFVFAAGALVAFAAVGLVLLALRSGVPNPWKCCCEQPCKCCPACEGKP